MRFVTDRQMASPDMLGNLVELLCGSVGCSDASGSVVDAFPDGTEPQVDLLSGAIVVAVALRSEFDAMGQVVSQELSFGNLQRLRYQSLHDGRGGITQPLHFLGGIVVADFYFNCVQSWG